MTSSDLGVRDPDTRVVCRSPSRNGSGFPGPPAFFCGEGDAVGTFQMDFLVPATYAVSVTFPDGDTFYDGLTVDPVEVEVPEATAVSDVILEIVEQASGG